ncbi:hypothetical protein Leryth_017544 [Lithospermum erythrorhizon]|nr:hypothetical protein Leryth_017544 [Lithospermum erythrorhizon]
MKPVLDENKGNITIKAACRADEEKTKHIEKVEVKTHDVDTIKYVEKKLVEKGVQRLERHPADGLPLKHDPKKGHGGKYTWEGPSKGVENELEVAPIAIDENDPNYVDEEEEKKIDEVGEIVVGEVEVAKKDEEGVARIEVDPKLMTN